MRRRNLNPLHQDSLCDSSRHRSTALGPLLVADAVLAAVGMEGGAVGIEGGAVGMEGGGVDMEGREADVGGSEVECCILVGVRTEDVEVTRDAMGREGIS